MFTRYDKAGARDFGRRLGAAISQSIGLHEAVSAALATVFTAMFVFLLPRKRESQR